VPAAFSVPFDFFFVIASMREFVIEVALLAALSLKARGAGGARACM
jgi:hypothetical protein